MDDSFDDMYETAVSTGMQNLSVLRLAAAWCQHIGVTKGPLGTGVLEATTGLPISGGSLRCEHAKAPTSFSMSLADGAVAFYAQNCIGCSHRKPTAATEHLGTWADAIIAETNKRLQEREQALREAERARKRRREDRRLRFGLPNPTGQSILDLIDRVDSEIGDEEAESLLVRHAEMSPGDFPDPLLQHMVDEAIAIGNGPLLSAVVAVFERDGRPGVPTMLEIAFAALAAGVAPIAAGSVVAAHARDFCNQEDTLSAIVYLAAGHSDGMAPYRVDARPAALLRIYDIDKDRMAEYMSRMLRAEDVWVRATAAHAADRLIWARPDAGDRLTAALLDAVALPDKSRYLGDPFASSRVQAVIAQVLLMTPETTSALVDERLSRSDKSHQRRIWKCYDAVVRPDADETLLGGLCEIIWARAAALLEQPDVEPDFAREIADTLSLLASYHGDVLDIDTGKLIDLLVVFAKRREQIDTANTQAQSTGSEEQALENLDRRSHYTTLGGVFYTLQKALTVGAKRNVLDFVDALRTHVWKTTENSRDVRTALLDVLGDIVSSQTELERAEPLLRVAVHERERIGERAAALKALADIGTEGLSLPEWAADAVRNALSDEYLAVVRAGIRALPCIEVRDDQRVDVINRLLGFAAAYGPKRSYSDDVESALRSVLHLAEATLYKTKAEDFVLRTIGEFPSSEALRIFDRLPMSEEHPFWPGTVVAILRVDRDPRWSDLRSAERGRVLRTLATVRTEVIAPVVADLERVGREWLQHDRTWTWAVSDVLARHGEHARAASLCDTVVEMLPDTTERRPARHFARLISLGHHINAAVALDDGDAVERLLTESQALVAQLED